MLPVVTRPKLFLHIGHGKVASSTIQAALQANIDVLRSQGFLVADDQLRFPVAGPVTANAVPYFTKMRQMEGGGDADFGGRMGALEAHRASGRYHTAIISAENLTAPGLESIGPQLLHVFDVQVLYYVRRPDDWLLSAWKQWGVKQGVGIAEFFEEAIGNGHPPFLKVAERWQEAAGAIRVRPLHPDALEGGDIVRDVFHAIGCKPEVTDLPRVNPSFDLSLLEVMAQSPFLFDDRNDNRLFHYLQQVLPEEFPHERLALGRDMLERLHARLEGDNRELHRRFFPAVDYDAVFGWRDPKPVTSEPLDRIRRVLGLQLGRLQDLEQRVAALESRGGQGVEP